MSETHRRDGGRFWRFMEARKAERGWTDLDLATALGVNPATVAGWKRWGSLPQRRTLAKIRDVFGETPPPFREEPTDG